LIDQKEILMRNRKLSAAVAVLVPFVLAAPVAGARADTTPTASRAASPLLLTFVPPRVGPLSVSLGQTIIDGQVISPGVSVSTPGTSLPPMAWTLPG
jgi:hypothetical protein